LLFAQWEFIGGGPLSLLKASTDALFKLSVRQTDPKNRFHKSFNNLERNKAWQSTLDVDENLHLDKRLGTKHGNQQ
jgi:hypothetical protein